MELTTLSSSTRVRSSTVVTAVLALMRQYLGAKSDSVRKTTRGSTPPPVLLSFFLCPGAPFLLLQQLKKLPTPAWIVRLFRHRRPINATLLCRCGVMMMRAQRPILSRSMAMHPSCSRLSLQRHLRKPSKPKKLKRLPLPQKLLVLLPLPMLRSLRRNEGRRLLPPSIRHSPARIHTASSCSYKPLDV